MKKICSIEKCVSQVLARGWCRKHYARWWKHGDPTTIIDQSGKNSPKYKHGGCCEPVYCECGRTKDYRSNKCAICARTGISISGEKLVSNKKVTEAILSSISYLEAAEKLGVTRRVVTRRKRKLNLDISHFKGGRGRPVSIDKALVKDSHVNAGTIRNLVKRGELLTYICSECRIKPEWNGRNLTLQLHHINGNSKDNRLENLKWLCPNCHSQTENYTGKNGKNKKSR